jgi:phosphoglycerate dehydrogenase-like enzyme
MGSLCIISQSFRLMQSFVSLKKKLLFVSQIVSHGQRPAFWVVEWTGYGAIRNVAVVRSGDSVGVFGCGAVGLNVVKSAQLTGASQVLVSTPHSPDVKERCPLEPPMSSLQRKH